MTHFFSQHVSVPDDVLMRELDGESVILDLASENYYGLDDIGTRMWQALSSSDTIQEACDALLLEYDVEPHRLQQDMQELVTQLVASGLLQLEADQA
jgi:hypothetical protein